MAVKKAVATAQIFQTPVIVASLVTLAILADVDVPLAVALGAAFIAGALLGATLVLRFVPEHWLRPAVGVLLLAVAVFAAVRISITS